MGSLHPEYQPSVFFQTFKFQHVCEDDVFGILYKFQNEELQTAFVQTVDLDCRGIFSIKDIREQFELRHPPENILSVYQYFQTSGKALNPYFGNLRPWDNDEIVDVIIFEAFDDNGDLEQNMEKRKKEKQAYTEVELWEIAEHCIHALAKMQRYGFPQRSIDACKIYRDENSWKMSYVQPLINYLTEGTACKNKKCQKWHKQGKIQYIQSKDNNKSEVENVILNQVIDRMHDDFQEKDISCTFERDIENLGKMLLEASVIAVPNFDEFGQLTQQKLRDKIANKHKKKQKAKQNSVNEHFQSLNKYKKQQYQQMTKEERQKLAYVKATYKNTWYEFLEDCLVKNEFPDPNQIIAKQYKCRLTAIDFYKKMLNEDQTIETLDNDYQFEGERVEEEKEEVQIISNVRQNIKSVNAKVEQKLLTENVVRQPLPINQRTTVNYIPYVSPVRSYVPPVPSYVPPVPSYVPPVPSYVSPILPYNVNGVLPLQRNSMMYSPQMLLPRSSYNSYTQQMY